MRKKFVTVALLGTLIFTSTNFVGCSDYDDDIKNLQEQVDALKSISISDLASQLQSLKDANNNLGLADAKMEAAIAEIKTNIEALKKADEALTSLVNGKVDQATYQAAIKELNDKCSDLSTKLAALSALETAVNDLKANKADSATLEELKKAVEKLQSQDAEFATKIGKLENTIENMGTVLAGKADQTTVAALSESIAELKTGVAGIDAKISAALDPVQKNIAKLQEDIAKKADAATITADIEKVKSEMTGLIDALKASTASDLAGVKAELVGRITALETAKEQMGLEIQALKTSIEGLKDRMNRLENQPTTDLTEVKQAIADNKTAIDAANVTAGAIQGTINGIQSRLDGLGEGAGAVKTYIDNAVLTLNTAIVGQISTINGQLSSLQSEYDLTVADFEGRIGALEGIEYVNKSDFESLQSEFGDLKATVGNAENGLIKQLNDLSNKVDGLIAEALEATGPGSIEEKIAKQITAALSDSETIKKAIEDAIATVTKRVDDLEDNMDAVLSRIQSIVFVPEYQENGTAIVPVYRIANQNGIVTMKFRVSPADKAAELVGHPELFSFYKEDELQTRTTSENTFTAVKVEEGMDAGTILITADVVPSLGANSGVGNYYPVALKLSTSKEYGTEDESDIKPVNDITTEYFNVKVKDITSSTYSLASNQSILYTDTEEKEVNLLTVSVNYGHGDLTLAQCGFTQNLVIYAVECGGTWVKVNSLTDAQKATYITDRGFELVGNTAVKLLSPIDINRVNNTLKVQLVDNEIFRLNPVKTFEVTYTITKQVDSKPIEYGMITKEDLKTGSNMNFDVVGSAFVWNGTASDVNQRYIISAKKADKFKDNEIVAGATADEILAAIQSGSYTSVTYLVNGNSATPASDPTFSFDVANDEIIVTVPDNKERQNYEMTTIYNFDLYGKITLKATLNLAYPTADQLWSHNQERWPENDLYYVNYTPVVGTPATLYNITHDLHTGYTYSYTDGVTYEYNLVKVASNIPLPDNSKLELSGSTIKFKQYVDLSKFRVELKASIGGHTVASEIFDITMDYPITSMIAKPTTTLTYKAADINAHTGLSIFEGVNLSDDYQNQIIKNGKIVTSPDWGTAYGLTGGTNNGNSYVMNNGVRYVITGDATLEGGGTMPASSFEITDDGKFHLKQNNLAKNASVKVRIEIDYTYGTVVSEEFEIKLEKTYTGQ